MHIRVMLAVQITEKITYTDDERALCKSRFRRHAQTFFVFLQRRYPKHAPLIVQRRNPNGETIASTPRRNPKVV